MALIYGTAGGGGVRSWKGNENASQFKPSMDLAQRRRRSIGGVEGIVTASQVGERGRRPRGRSKLQSELVFG